jgi:crotonobetainyl-CoA:carnitine CoA-transferase CaiB-like acyl-CoA transferase
MKSASSPASVDLLLSGFVLPERSGRNPVDTHIELNGARTGPLNGIRVADFSAIFSGPIAGAMLADQGADVIKVEAFTGDLMRKGFPQSNGMASAFTTMNRNKRGISLNLQTEAGKAAAIRLIQTSDVVLENFRPGVMDRLGLGYDAFKESQPKLVYASINGVGANGPYANRRVYDAVIQAVSGFTALRVDGKPEMVNSLVCDKVTSLTAAEAIVAALFSAERTGRGQRVEISMLDAALSFLWPDTMNNFTFMDDGIQPVAPLDHSVFLHETKDGWIASMPVQESEFFGVFRALELPELVEDERFQNTAARLEHRLALRELMDRAYPKFTTDELCQRFETQDVPYSRLNSREEVLEDPQVKAMGALLTYEHPTAGLVRTPRPAAQFAGTPSSLHSHTPTLGEHTDEVLLELGYSRAEIEEMAQADAVFRSSSNL